MTFSQRRRLGNVGESVACTFLEKRGFTILARNYLRPWGEIDIIARLGNCYRFVEVKTISREKGSTRTVGMTAEDHVHPSKLKRLVRTVELYVADSPGISEYQIDLIAVELDTKTRRASCKLYEQVL